MRAGGARFLARRVRGARVTLVRERGGRDMHRKSAASARKVWFRGNEGGAKVADAGAISRKRLTKSPKTAS